MEGVKKQKSGRDVAMQRLYHKKVVSFVMPVDNPSKFAEKFVVDSPRLAGWDYSTPGNYFITICTVNHNKFFGNIIDNKMILSKMGIIANQCLIDIPRHFANIKLVEYVVMPNHVHILMEIVEDKLTNTNNMVETLQCNVSTKPNQINNILINHQNNKFRFYNQNKIKPKIRYISDEKRKFYSSISPKPKSIPTIIRSYKSAVTKLINPKTVFFGWQTRFHDEIIRDEKSLMATRIYIKNNVKNWKKDEFNK